LSICQQPSTDLIYLDETGYEPHVRPVYGWLRLSTNVAMNVPTNRGCNVSVIATMGINGLLAIKIISGALNATVLIDYLTNTPY
jgi:hypothetical protein